MNALPVLSAWALPAAALLLAALPEPPHPYLAMLAAGFVIGVWGHGMRAPVVVAFGIALVMVTTALLIIASQDLAERPLPGV